MRLKPVAPIIMLQPTRDTVVADIEVPKGTLIMCLMRAGATDERRFPDAHAFDPGRWLSGASASSPKRVSMPFGAGPRLCPGRYLAILEMKMVMAMLLAGFDIERVTTPDGGEAKEHLAFTMFPVGLRLKLRLRSSSVAAGTHDSQKENWAPPSRGRLLQTFPSQTARMLPARGPFGLCSTSYCTLSFSFSVLKPAAWIDEKCTKRSLPPSSGVMKPKPFASLNHFTVPVLMCLFP